MIDRELQMTEKISRRDVVKSSTVGMTVVAATVATGGVASAQMEGYSAKRNLGTVSINPNAKAVLPGGINLSRAEILSKLGLNPNTPPDAWLAIISCGSNGSALMNAGTMRMNPTTMPGGKTPGQ